MQRLLVIVFAAFCLNVAVPQTQQQPQSFVGRIADSHCGASHQPKAGSLADRQCVFLCLKGLAKWVLVDFKNNVFVIANQDLQGLPLYAARPVRLMGELKDGAIVASRVEAYPPHLHLGHVMTNWRDTPGGVGLLIAAISEARIAVVHAKLAASSVDNLDGMKLHAGHVLNALDPTAETTETTKGPGAGYGVKKGATGAQQHLDFAVKAEGASANLTAGAVQVTASLTETLRLTEDAITTVQQTRAATTAAQAAPLVRRLEDLAGQIVERGLNPAHEQMAAILKAEGLENAPR